MLLCGAQAARIPANLFARGLTVYRHGVMYQRFHAMVPKVLREPIALPTRHHKQVENMIFRMQWGSQGFYQGVMYLAKISRGNLLTTLIERFEPIQPYEQQCRLQFIQSAVEPQLRMLVTHA